MRIAVLSLFALLLFACNNQKETLALKRQNDSLRAEVDSLKAFYINTKFAKQIKAKRDSLRKIKWTFWKKQSAQLNLSIRVDKGALAHAKLHLKSELPSRRKRIIEEADRTLITDEKREDAVRDSVRKYQN